MPEHTHPQRSTLPRKSLRWLFLLALLFAGCRADQISKSWARDAFMDKAPMTLVPDLLEFRYAENHAIAFSMLHQLSDTVRTPLILTLTTVAMAALLSLIWKMRNQGIARLTPLALILAGALGNLQDRLTHGYVVDFVHVHWRQDWSFPIFNLADSLITVGAALLILQSFIKQDPEEQSGPQDKPDAEPTGTPPGLNS